MENAIDDSNAIHEPSDAHNGLIHVGVAGRQSGGRPKRVGDCSGGQARGRRADRAAGGRRVKGVRPGEMLAEGVLLIFNATFAFKDPR